jgi:hypothetical protein
VLGGYHRCALIEQPRKRVHLAGQPSEIIVRALDLEGLDQLAE